MKDTLVHFLRDSFGRSRAIHFSGFRTIGTQSGYLFFTLLNERDAIGLQKATMGRNRAIPVRKVKNG